MHFLKNILDLTKDRNVIDLFYIFFQFVLKFADFISVLFV